MFAHPNMKIGVGIVQGNTVYPNHESDCCADWCNKKKLCRGAISVDTPNRCIFQETSRTSRLLRKYAD